MFLSKEDYYNCLLLDSQSMGIIERGILDKFS